MLSFLKDRVGSCGSLPAAASKCIKMTLASGYVGFVPILMLTTIYALWRYIGDTHSSCCLRLVKNMFDIEKGNRVPL